MIDRIYLDNVRTFVNFEWKPGPLAVLVGDNGGGKTALLETLEALQAFLLGDASSPGAFPAATRTRWETARREQTFEIDVAGKGGLFTYRLVIEHNDGDPSKNRVTSESLKFDDKVLVEQAGGDLQLHQDDGTPGPRLATNPTRSAIGTVQPGTDNRLLTWFKAWLFKLWLVRPDPRAMTARINGGDVRPGPARIDRAAHAWLASDLSNFVAFYKRWMTEKTDAMFKATAALKQVLPGFIELPEREGRFWARFGDETASTTYGFDELSDGQRALIALYVLRHTVLGAGDTLFIDEPDNYVSLREVQPWVLEVIDATLTKGGAQAILISHHPEVLNLIAREHGWVFFRDANGPTRVERFAPAHFERWGIRAPRDDRAATVPIPKSA